MILKNSNEFDVEIIDENNKVVFTLGEEECAKISVDVKRMIDWRIRYPNNSYIYLFDMFNDALSDVDINLKGTVDYSYDGSNYNIMGTAMPRTIQ